jgi:hypothetical protein
MNPKLLADLAEASQSVALRHIFVSLVASAVALAFPALTKRWAAALGIAATAGIYTWAFPGWLAVAAAVYALAAIIVRLGPELRWRTSCGANLLLVAVFLGARRGGLDAYARVEIGSAQWQLFVFDMFAVMRLVTFLWEAGSGKITPDPLTYVTWIALPFTSGGPVLRYSEIQPQLERPAARRAPHATRAFWLRLGSGFGRIALGLLLGIAFEHVRADLSRWPRALVGMNVGPWAFYLVTSGYCVVMEQLAVTWGITLPGSFDKPFGRPDLSAFWATWNATATRVFRDYLFYNRWGFRRSNLYLNGVIVFVACGLWHEMNAYWLLWGLTHGIGFAVTLGWKRLVRTRPSLTLPRPVASALTYAFVIGAWVLPPRIIALL